MENMNCDEIDYYDSTYENGKSFDDYSDYYKRLRKRMKRWLNSKNGKNNKWADYLMFAPDLFHVLIKLLFDKDISSTDKAKLVGVVAYFVIPVDLVPEALLGMLGYVDDIALAALALNGLINRTDEEIVRKYWAGDKDVLEVIKQIIEVADTMLGSGMWKRICEMNKNGI